MKIVAFFLNYFFHELMKQIYEELAEFQAETDFDKKEQELGDVFFSLVNYARISNINPDTALEKTNNKFINRFQKMENLALEDEVSLEDLSIEKMDEYWEKIKGILKKNKC